MIDNQRGDIDFTPCRITLGGIIIPKGCYQTKDFSSGFSDVSSSNVFVNTNAQRRFEQLEERERASIYMIMKARGRNKEIPQTENDIHPPGVFGPLFRTPFSRYGRQMTNTVKIFHTNYVNVRNCLKTVAVGEKERGPTTTHIHQQVSQTIWTNGLIKARILKIVASSEKGHNVRLALRLARQWLRLLKLIFESEMHRSGAEQIVYESTIVDAFQNQVDLCNASPGALKSFKISLGIDDYPQSRTQSEQPSSRQIGVIQ